jgi:hypothetical protein
MHDDFKSEPIRGLPEALPPGEHILWQGSPSARALARDAWGIRWVIGYFAVLMIWRIVVSSADVPLGTAIGHGIPFLVIGSVACALIFGLATIQSRATVYTLTNKRVAMRIGTALTMTLNLPYVQIGSASVSASSDGHGIIAFELLGDTKLSYLMTWPNVRPWYMARPQPALRSIKDVDQVARIFSEAAELRTSQPQVTRAAPMAVAAE